MNNFTKSMLAISALAISGAASAIPLVGTVSFSSETNALWTPVDAGYVATSIASSTGVAFTAGDNGFDQNVTTATGDFAGTENTGVDFFDFQYDPLGPATTVLGTPLWTFASGGTTYSFTMDSVTLIAKGTSTLTLEGTGTLSGTPGFDDTSGTWDFSGNAFSFSSSAVPEPALALLLGTGLIGFGVSRKLRNKA